MENSIALPTHASRVPYISIAVPKIHIRQKNWDVGEEHRALALAYIPPISQSLSTTPKDLLANPVDSNFVTQEQERSQWVPKHLYKPKDWLPATKESA